MSERLDRIEAILDRISQRQEESDRKFEQRQEEFDRKFEETRAIVESNARAIQTATERHNELDRDWEETKFIVRSNARAIQAATERHNQLDRDWEETKSIARSNARTIQAMLDRQESERLEREENNAKFESAMLKLADVQKSMAKWLANVDDNQPTILKRLMSIENKIDRILDNDS